MDSRLYLIGAGLLFAAGIALVFVGVLLNAFRELRDLDL